ncbi:uncharacterized protein G2W53_011711 [Senna tora]|uniref:Uncharacterized protein n=1 Tax=Senna tora TaxID=362788 RepID=A0A835CFG9_9FABA|nr:uncharacterized protein G2W53_011711 [Senna tora]
MNPPSLKLQLIPHPLLHRPPVGSRKAGPGGDGSNKLMAKPMSRPNSVLILVVVALSMLLVFSSRS